MLEDFILREKITPFDHERIPERIGALPEAGFDEKLKNDLIAKINKEGAKAAIITSRIQGEVDARGTLHAADIGIRFDSAVPLCKRLILRVHGPYLPAPAGGGGAL